MNARSATNHTETELLGQIPKSGVAFLIFTSPVRDDCTPTPPGLAHM